GRRGRPILLAISGAAGFVLALLVVARLALPGWLKGKVERLAGEATGRALTIGGPLEISLFGSPTLAVGDVRFSNAPGGSEPSMVSAGRLAVTLELRPLLSGQVHLRRVELEDVRVLLEKDAGGRPNWALDLPEGEPRGTPERKVIVDEAGLRRFRLAYRPGGALNPLDFGVETFSARRDTATDMVALDGRGDFNAEAWHLAGTVG